MQGKILVLDDDEHLACSIRQALVARGHAVDHLARPYAAMKHVYAGGYDLVLLDSHLPGIDGYTICKRLRQDEVEIPILMLTDKPNLDSVLLAFRSGADGYVKKPLSLAELVAHTETLLVRPPKPKVESAKYKGFCVDHKARKMLYAGMPFDLRNREFDIFALLLENPGTIFSREQILELSSDGTSAGSLASVDVHISNIRKRLKKLKVRNLIHTVHLKGYRLE